MTDSNQRVRILVSGLRGIGDIEGGVEQHAQRLYPRLIERGYEITVIARTPYVSAKQEEWQGVRIKRIWSPAGTGIEAFIHTLLATVYAIFVRPDVYHVHAIGPGLFVPLARLFGLRVIFTHHGPDYDREKWGVFATRLLKLGERWACNNASLCIVISKTIAAMVKSKYGVNTVLIANGVDSPPTVEFEAVLAEMELTPSNYVLQVSRIVPEKRQLDLVEAFAEAKLADWCLVFAGGLDDSQYSQRLRAVADARDDIKLVGFVNGEQLQSLFYGAGIFVLPSSHEGLPIALLEALSYGAQVIASDIPANLEVGLDTQHYFRLGDTSELASRLSDFSRNPYRPETKAALASWVTAQYNWDDIAVQTDDVYRSALGN